MVEEGRRAGRPAVGSAVLESYYACAPIGVASGVFVPGRSAAVWYDTAPRGWANALFPRNQLISFATTPAVLLLAGTFCYAVMGAVLLRYREAPGATVTAYALTACLIWVAGGLATSVVDDLPLQLLALNVSYIGACATPVVILVFVSFYASAKPIEWSVTRWLLVLPAISVLLVWTNPFHEAMWAHPPLDAAGGFSLRAEWGPWFKFVHLPYMWTLALVGAAYLLRAMVGQSGLSRATGSRITRGQATVLFGVLVTTLVVNVVAVIGPVPPGGVSTSPTAVAIALSSFCFLWLFAQVELVPLRHVAHKRILHTMPDPVFVLDEHDRVLDLNPRASELVKDPAPAGRFAQALFAEEPALLALLRQDGDVLSEVRMQTGLSYEVRVSPFHDATGTRRGRTLMLRDVTELNLHNRRMHSIVDVSPNGIVRLLADIDEQGVVQDAICIFANASAAAYLGVEHATMAGSRMLPAMPAVGPQMLGVFQKALNEGQDQQVDVPVAGENEDPLWFRVIVSPVDEELMITFMEVTEEKRREAEMQEVAYGTRSRMR